MENAQSSFFYGAGYDTCLGIPVELFKQILFWCDAKCLTRLMMTNTEHYNLIHQDEGLWRVLLSRLHSDNGIPQGTFKPTEGDIKCLRDTLSVPYLFQTCMSGDAPSKSFVAKDIPLQLPSPDQRIEDAKLIPGGRFLIGLARVLGGNFSCRLAIWDLQSRLRSRQAPIVGDILLSAIWEDSFVVQSSLDSQLCNVFWMDNIIALNSDLDEGNNEISVLQVATFDPLKIGMEGDQCLKIIKTIHLPKLRLSNRSLLIHGSLAFIRSLNPNKATIVDWITERAVDIKLTGSRQAYLYKAKLLSMTECRMILWDGMEDEVAVYRSSGSLPWSETSQRLKVSFEYDQIQSFKITHTLGSGEEEHDREPDVACILPDWTVPNGPRDALFTISEPYAQAYLTISGGTISAPLMYAMENELNDPFDFPGEESLGFIRTVDGHLVLWNTKVGNMIFLFRKSQQKYSGRTIEDRWSSPNGNVSQFPPDSGCGVTGILANLIPGQRASFVRIWAMKRK